MKLTWRVVPVGEKVFIILSSLRFVLKIMEIKRKVKTS